MHLKLFTGLKILFCCFTGLAFSDVKTVTKDNLMSIEGVTWLNKRRVKTDVESRIPLSVVPFKLIEKYKEHPMLEEPHYNQRIIDKAGKIPENEPVFLLRAQDVHAPSTLKALRKTFRGKRKYRDGRRITKTR